MRAAIVAETARLQGCFWSVHDSLYASDARSFDDSAIDNVIRGAHLNASVIARTGVTPAKIAVESDIREAAKLGLGHTPSFILCEPNGRVLYLRNLEQLGAYVRQ
jgi:hypothetical protein